MGNTARVASTVIGVVLAVFVGFFAIKDASSSGGGAEARSTMTIIAPAAAGGGWDLGAREYQQATRTDGIVNNSQVVNIPGVSGTIGLRELARFEGGWNPHHVHGRNAHRWCGDGWIRHRA